MESEYTVPGDGKQDFFVLVLSRRNAPRKIKMKKTRKKTRQGRIPCPVTFLAFSSSGKPRSLGFATRRTSALHGKMGRRKRLIRAAGHIRISLF
jgi:hypothetical protein